MKGTSENTLVVAIGSAHGDDQVGWLVADRLEALLHEQTSLRKASVPVNMIDWMEGVDNLHIIDACVSGDETGRLLHITWPFDHETVFRAGGTHDFSLPLVLELAAKLNKLPGSVRIWGIVGQKFSPDDTISVELATRIDSIAQAIGKEINDARVFTGAVAVEPG